MLKLYHSSKYVDGQCVTVSC